MAAVVVVMLATVACTSEDDPRSAAPTASATAPTPAPPPPTAGTAPTVTGGPTISPSDGDAPPPSPAPEVSVEDVESFDAVGNALPDLIATTDDAMHVIELRLRTLQVTVAEGQVCLSGGEVPPVADNCAPLADGPGVLVYSDNAPTTRVYAILTAADVTVEFRSTGPSLTCFSEPVTRVGSMIVSWCEDQFAPTIRFFAPGGRVLQVSIG